MILLAEVKLGIGWKRACRCWGSQGTGGLFEEYSFGLYGMEVGLKE